MCESLVTMFLGEDAVTPGGCDLVPDMMNFTNGLSEPEFDLESLLHPLPMPLTKTSVNPFDFDQAKASVTDPMSPPVGWKEEFVLLEHSELRKRLKSLCYSTERVKEIRSYRRKIKNRKYAKQSRKRRLKRQAEIDIEQNKEIEDVRRQNRILMALLARHHVSLLEIKEALDAET
jgi:hypothetical protein